MSTNMCRRGGCERIANDEPMIGDDVAMSNEFDS